MNAVYRQYTPCHFEESAEMQLFSNGKNECQINGISDPVIE